MRLPIVAAILAKEFKEARRNRTLLLVVLLPLMASVAFSWLQSEEMARITVGVPASHRDVFARALPPDVVRLETYRDGADPLPLLEAQGGWDAAIVTGPDFAAALREGRPVQLRVVVSSRLGPAGRLTAAQLPLLLRTLGSEPLVHAELEGLGAASSDRGLLTVWITVTAVMIGIMIMAGNVAEERERGTLLALITSPARLGEVLGAKAVFGTLLPAGMGMAMLLLHGAGLREAVRALVALLPGGLCFTTFGLFIGFLAPNQATARSYGTLLYLPLLVPVFGHDASAWMARVSAYAPSYRLWAALEAALAPPPAGEPLLSHAAWLVAFAAAGACLLAAAARRRPF